MQGLQGQMETLGYLGYFYLGTASFRNMLELSSFKVQMT